MADSSRTMRATENGRLSMASADLPSTITGSECTSSIDGPSTTSNQIGRIEEAQQNDAPKSSLDLSSNECDSKESDREGRDADDKIDNESIDTPHKTQNQPSKLKFEILALKEKLAEIELQSSAVRQELQCVIDGAESIGTQLADRARDTNVRPRFEIDSGNIGIDDDVYNFRRRMLQMDFDHEIMVLERRRDFQFTPAWWLPDWISTLFNEGPRRRAAPTTSSQLAGRTARRTTAERRKTSRWPPSDRQFAIPSTRISFTTITSITTSSTTARYQARAEPCIMEWV